MLELHFAISRILHDTGLNNHAEGDDILQARSLFIAFLLERFGPETMRNIEAALEKPIAARVQDVYDKLQSNQFEIPADIPDGVSSAMSVQAGDMSTFVNLLKGGGKLSSDPDEALDQIARQIADREDATFATLDPTARRKVALIAGVLGDKAKKAISDGVGIALDPEGGSNVLVVSGGVEKRRVTLDCKGGNHIVMQIQTERTGATLRTGAESYQLGPGSVVRTGYRFELDQDAMKRFEQDVDLDTFDGTKAEEIASAPGNVPGRVGRVREALGQNLVLGNVSNAASIDFVLN